MEWMISIEIENLLNTVLINDSVNQSVEFDNQFL